MHINYLDIFSITVTGEQGDTYRFVCDEYATCIAEQPATEPALHIEFCPDRMAEDGYVVRAPVSYDERSMFIFDHDRRIARLDFDQLGQHNCRLQCDPDFHPPFFAILLEYIAHILAFQKGFFFCHAAACVDQDQTLLCPAWRNVGKTNTLLAFLSDGAHYLADDWCLMDTTGGARRIPKRLCLFDYNFLFQPELCDRINPKLRPLVEFYSRLTKGEYEVSRDCLDNLRDQLKVRVHPETLYPQQIADAAPRVDALFYMTRNVRDPERGIYVRPMTREQLVRQMVEVLRFEQTPFRLAYSIHKARTGTPNPLLEEEYRGLPKRIHDAYSSLSAYYEVLTPGQNHAEAVKDAIRETLRETHHAP